MCTFVYHGDDPETPTAQLVVVIQAESMDVVGGYMAANADAMATQG